MLRHDPRESSAERQRKAQQRLVDKVCVLERWYQEGGSPDTSFCPRRIGKFLEWEDPALRVEILRDGQETEVEGVYYVSAVTADKPCNKPFKDRAIELMGLLAKPKKTARKADELNVVKAERDQALRQLRTITNKYVMITEKEMTLEKENARKENRIRNLLEENGELRKKLSKVSSLYPVSGGDSK